MYRRNGEIFDSRPQDRWSPFSLLGYPTISDTFPVGVAITIGLAVLNLVIAIAAFELPDAKKLRPHIRFMFYVAVILAIIFSIVQSISDNNEKEALKTSIRQQNDNSEKAEVQYEKVIDVMGKSPAPLQAAIDALAEVSNNRASGSPATTERLEQVLDDMKASAVQQRNDYLGKLVPFGD